MVELSWILANIFLNDLNGITFGSGSYITKYYINNGSFYDNYSVEKTGIASATNLLIMIIIQTDIY